MKIVAPEAISDLPGKRLKDTDTFQFRCHEGLSCFNQCCRNLNLFLYPYDVIRLARCLEMNADAFLDTHVDVVMRPGNYFPDVLLRMADNPERTCPFLTPSGCRVYPDRPDTCRTFPVEHGILMGNSPTQTQRLSFFRPPDFCRGADETQTWTLSAWAKDQDAVMYNQMTAKWAGVKSLFLKNPWGHSGMEGQKGKMAFMAAYNVDRFREFVFQSSFLKRCRIKKELATKLRTSDRDLMLFGFEWIRFFIWAIPSPHIRM
ncbi:YkgJ family cysteine cluster protein [Desulfosarcina sp. OttesenSCG-928-A07]|nr:YkgJ family cysteine cluster protein [Desulfosarcina sp. OttesenSCG-928-G17]MDL2330269.1 YkgJ family cysteine cluster protein [Desulfosarcina sp. OttesenSCG-928-A07]